MTIDFVPGTSFRYSGGGYTIIQQILVDVTGEPFPDLMQEVVLQPLHTTHSTFQQPLPEKLQPLEAMPYGENGNAVEGGPHTYPEMAVAGLWTTPSDLALFALFEEAMHLGLLSMEMAPIGFLPPRRKCRIRSRLLCI